MPGEPVAPRTADAEAAAGRWRHRRSHCPRAVVRSAASARRSRSAPQRALGRWRCRSTPARAAAASSPRFRCGTTPARATDRSGWVGASTSRRSRARPTQACLATETRPSRTPSSSPAPRISCPLRTSPPAGRLREAVDRPSVSPSGRGPVRPHRALAGHRRLGESHWRVITRENVTSLYGLRGAPHRRPRRPPRIFQWLLERDL